MPLVRSASGGIQQMSQARWDQLAAAGRAGLTGDNQEVHELFSPHTNMTRLTPEQRAAFVAAQALPYPSPQQAGRKSRRNRKNKRRNSRKNRR